LVPVLRSTVSNEDWGRAALIVLGRFQVFIHFYRGGVCDSDETALFEALNDEVSNANAG
jgi:hypothetical protein